MDPAAEILALAEEERQLVHEGRADDLPALHDRRDAAMARLPAELSPDARAALAHALALQRQITTSLAAALTATRTELGQIAHGRTAARGYTPAGLDPRRTLDRVA